MTDNFKYIYPSGASAVIRATETGSKATADQVYIPHVVLDDGSGDQISDSNPLPVEITDGTNSADIVDSHGVKGLVAITPGHVCLENSTTDTLDPAEDFTGDWIDITNFGVVVVSVTSNVSSATDGFVVQFSSDGTEAGIISDDNFTVAAGAKKTFSFQAAAKYFRIVYSNGGTIQTSFNLQTVLKPYYVKPSSHRIQDNIVDDDDAELITNVNKAKSDLTGAFENITSYREALNVNSAWLHRKIVNETFHQHTETTTTIAVAVSINDYTITVDDPTGFAIGSEIKLEEGPIQELGIMTLTNVSGSDLTLDRWLSNDYTTAATVTKVNTNMALTAGTLASPQIYEIDPPILTVWQITRIMHSITDNLASDDSKFGGIAALTNGVSLRAITSAGRVASFGNWKTNRDMKLDMFDLPYTDKAGGGNYGVNGRWTFTNAEVVAELDGSGAPLQKMQIYIHDDLTELVSFTMRAQGRVFSS